MKFNIIIEKDEEGRYVAECTDLPGCLSEGETLGDALENINEAIIGCLKSRLKSAEERINTASNEYLLSAADAAHLAAMQANGIMSMASNDRDFKRVPWMKLWWPEIC